MGKNIKNNKIDNDNIFPFSTCEIPNKTGIAQPYSVIINVISIFIILYFLPQTKNMYSFILIFTFFVFECAHIFAHSIHLSSYIQINIIHCLAYVINLFLLLTLYNYTHQAPTPFFSVILLIILFLDIYFFMFCPFIFYFTSSLILFFFILIYYYKYIPKSKQKDILIILLLGIFIMLLFYNEKINCNKMLDIVPNFSFHSFLEIAGTVVFYFICKLFSTF